jgi:integrase
MASPWKAYTESEHICGGHVFLFVPASSTKAIYQMRLTLPGVPAKTFIIRRSLKTSSRTEAVRLATEAFFNYQARHFNALPLDALNWNNLTDLYFERYKESSVRVTNDKYCREFFSKFSNIQDIDETAIYEFYRWRIDYWKDFKPTGGQIGDGLPHSVALVPHYQTLRKCSVAVRSILKFAHERGLITVLPLSDIPASIKNRLPQENSRGTFRIEDYRKLLRCIRKRCYVVSRRLTPDGRNCRTQEVIAIERIRLLVLLIANSCLRPGEATKLKGRDIHLKIGDTAFERSKNIQYTVIDVPSEIAKLHRPRRVITHDFHHTYNYLLRYRKIQEAHGIPYGDDYYIFNKTTDHDNFQPCATYFRKLLDTWDLAYDHSGNTRKIRSLYSLRSFAISMALERGVPPQAVSKNAACSMRVLEQNYFRSLSWNLRGLLVRNRYPESVPADERSFDVLSDNDYEDLQIR